MVGWGRSSVVSTGRGSGVLGLSGVSHVSNVAVVVVGVVGHSLGSAIGKSHGVGASNNTVAVVVLLLVESSLGVVISHGVGELVGRHLSKVSSCVSSLHGGVVGGGGLVSNWSWSIGGGVVEHGGVVGGGVVDSVHSVVDGVDSVMEGVDSVGNNAVSSVQPVGG